MKNGNFFKKETKRKNKNAIKRINKKHGKNMQNGAIKPQKRKKSLKKQIFRLEAPDFAAISSKNRAETPKKSPEKAVRG